MRKITEKDKDTFEMLEQAREQMGFTKEEMSIYLRGHLDTREVLEKRIKDVEAETIKKVMEIVEQMMETHEQNYKRFTNEHDHIGCERADAKVQVLNIAKQKIEGLK